MPMQPTELIRMADMDKIGKMFNQKVAGTDPVAENREQQRQDAQLGKLKAKFGSSDEKVEDLKTTITMLQSQVANLKDQVTKLKHQLSQLQKQNARELADNVLLQHMVAPGEAEVDLHIDMLSTRPADLSAHEAFELQMRYFRTCMNHAMANKLKKVTFIHGVGRGILKDEIQKELKQYEGVAVMDAPMQKFGVGATEVYFSTK